MLLFSSFLSFLHSNHRRAAGRPGGGGVYMPTVFRGNGGRVTRLRCRGVNGADVRHRRADCERSCRECGSGRRSRWRRPSLPTRRVSTPEESQQHLLADETSFCFVFTSRARGQCNCFGFCCVVVFNSHTTGGTSASRVSSFAWNESVSSHCGSS